MVRPISVTQLDSFDFSPAAADVSSRSTPASRTLLLGRNSASSASICLAPQGELKTRFRDSSMAASASASSPRAGNQMRRPNRTEGNRPAAAISYTLDLRKPSCRPTSDALRNTRLLLSSVCLCPLLRTIYPPHSRVTMKWWGRVTYFAANAGRHGKRAVMPVSGWPILEVRVE